MKRSFLVLAAATGLFNAPVFAQSCASPIEISGVVSQFAGNTCNSSNQLPNLANGMIYSPGSQDIYHLSIADGTGVQLHLTPAAALDGVLFVCRNVCATYSTCIAAVDSGGAGIAEVASLPSGPGDYYVIVGSSASPVCGTYNLVLSSPLDAH